MYSILSMVLTLHVERGCLLPLLCGLGDRGAAIGGDIPGVAPGAGRVILTVLVTHAAAAGRHPRAPWIAVVLRVTGVAADSSGMVLGTSPLPGWIVGIYCHYL